MQLTVYFCSHRQILNDIALPLEVHPLCEIGDPFFDFFDSFLHLSIILREYCLHLKIMNNLFNQLLHFHLFLHFQGLYDTRINSVFQSFHEFILKLVASITWQLAFSSKLRNTNFSQFLFVILFELVS